MLKYLNNKLIIVENGPVDKKEIIEKLVELIYKNTKKVSNKELFLEKIFERENMGTTGIGKGIAVPHARCEEVADVVMAIAVVKSGVEFNTPDDEKAKVILLVGAPKNKNNEYLDLLASISKSFRNSEFRGNVICANSEDELVEIVANYFED